MTLANFQMNPNLTAAGLSEYEQKLVHLNRAMMEFEMKGGPSVDNDKGSLSVHPAYIRNAAMRKEHRDILNPFLKRVVSTSLLRSF